MSKNEAAYFADVIERLARDVLKQIADLPDPLLNQSVPIPETNTLFAIATHTVGMGEFWVLALTGGWPISRDRASEFHATGHKTDLIQRYEKWIQDVHTVLDALPDSRMDDLAEPPREYSSTGGLREHPLAIRECLLHVVEHTGTHLGHIQITRQLMLSLQDGELTS